MNPRDNCGRTVVEQAMSRTQVLAIDEPILVEVEVDETFALLQPEPSEIEFYAKNKCPSSTNHKIEKIFSRILLLGSKKEIKMNIRVAHYLHYF